MSMFGRNVARGAQQFGRLLNRNANVVGRKITNTSNDIARGIGTAQRVVGAVEKLSGGNPILSTVNNALGVARSGAQIAGDLGSGIRGVSSGNVNQTLDAGNSLLNHSGQFTSGVVKTGLPLMLL